MESEYILVELKELSSNDAITKEELMFILKEYAATISVYDLMIASEHMRKDGEFVQANYREKFFEIYIKHFILRMKEVLKKEDYEHNKPIDKKSYIESFPRLEQTFEKEKLGIHKDDKFPLIYVITALYTTFILEEPIHPVGSEYPGGLKIEERNGEYYCPVKDKQKDNINAVCHLCLAKQTPPI
jgi:uncharacterized protein (UPF0305 family)